MYRVPAQRIANADYVFPRTLEQAFGPGERGPLFEPAPRKRMDWEDEVVLWLAPAVLLFITLLLVLESI